MIPTSVCKQLQNIEREQAASFGVDPMPCPPAWARARVDEICGGGDLTDDMPNIAYLRLAEYVAAREARS